MYVYATALKYDPQQLRDDDGKFTKEGVSNSLIHALRQADGGFTYSPTSKTSPTTGYMVSIYKSREVVLDLKDVKGVTLAAFVRENRDLLRKKGNYLGAWHDPKTGKIYLDVAQRTETAAEAAHLGRKHDQLAYFDLVKGKSVDLKANHGKKTRTKADWRSGVGGSGKTDGAVDRQGSHAQGDRGDEEDPRLVGDTMALKMMINTDPAPQPLHEVPPPVKKVDYAAILKGTVNKPVDK